MITLDCVQGSTEWHAARLGLPTASQASRIITPKGLKYASAAAGYRNQLLAEWAFGYPVLEGGNSGWTVRGTEMEAEARAWLCFERGYDVAQVGFVLRDDGGFGCSPDGLVGEDGIVELKVPAAHTHIGYLVSPDLLIAEYIAQVQSGMYVTGRAWTDLASYAPGLPCVLKRIERDDKFIVQLHRHLWRFREELLAGKRQLIAAGFVPRPGTEPTEAEALEPEELVAQMYDQVGAA